MRYFKILDLNRSFLGLATSFDLYRFIEKKKIMVHSDIKQVQYIMLNNKFYHGTDFINEPKSIEGEYDKVIVREITEEEYNKLK